MLKSWLLVWLLPSLAYSVNITFYEGKGCSGPRLFGDSITGSLPCYNVSGYEPANSSSVDFLATGQQVIFYSDAECQQEVFSSQDNVCYLHTHTTVRAVQILSEATRVVDSLAVQNSSTKDIAIYEMPVSDDLSVKAVSALPLSNYYAGVSLDTAAGGLALGIWGGSCYLAISNVDPTSIVLCTLSPVSSVLTWAAARLKRNAATKLRASANMALGQIHDVKRDVQGDQSWVNDDSDEFAEQHVGFMEHGTGSGNQTSPVYEFLGQDGETYHAAAFHYAESGSLIHRVYPARHAVLDKRDGPGYLSVRIDEGGLDIASCNTNEAANTSGLNGKSNDELYDIFYNDLECLINPDELLEAHRVYIELFNGARNLVSGFDIRPFRGNEGGITGSP